MDLVVFQRKISPRAKSPRLKAIIRSSKFYQATRSSHICCTSSVGLLQNCQSSGASLARNPNRLRRIVPPASVPRASPSSPAPPVYIPVTFSQAIPHFESQFLNQGILFNTYIFYGRWTYATIERNCVRPEYSYGEQQHVHISAM